MCVSMQGSLTAPQGWARSALQARIGRLEGLAEKGKQALVPVVVFC